MVMNTKLLPYRGSFLRMLGGIGVWWETELPNSYQIGHHIHSQYSQSDFVGAEDYPLRGGNKDFEVSEENSRERTSLFRSWTHSSSKFLRCRLGRVTFW